MLDFQRHYQIAMLYFLFWWGASCILCSFSGSSWKPSTLNLSVCVHGSKVAEILWNFPSHGRKMWLLWRTNCSKSKKNTLNLFNTCSTIPSPLESFTKMRCKLSVLMPSILLLTSFARIWAQPGLTSKAMVLDSDMNQHGIATSKYYICL